MQLPRQILIVEDEWDLLVALRSYLTDRGHHVMTASTVDEALAWLRHSAPEMAFIDLKLPNGNGRTIIQSIVKQQLPTRMIVITGCADLDLRRELLAYGVTDYLFKPVTLREIGRLLTTPSAPAPTPPASAEDAATPVTETIS